MRSPNDQARVCPAHAALAVGLAAALSGCGMFGGDGFAGELPAGPSHAGAAQTGPAADYPIVVGEPYRVAGTLYTPVDTLNYDEVGYAAVENGGGSGVTAAHHTLPLPSYVEVTSLDSGRTILVRLERRGPMTDTSLIALSPNAASQLGIDAGSPVRVRRVNPPEQERAALRMGGRVPERLETPEGLLAVLRRKLPEGGAAALAQAPAPRAPVATSPAPVAVPPSAPANNRRTASLALPPLGDAPGAAPAPAAPTQRVQASRPAPQPAVAANGDFVVQAGAFSTMDRASRVANVIGGSVSRSGGLYRVRTGPFLTRGQAEASLAKVRAAGYSDARIFTNG